MRSFDWSGIERTDRQLGRTTAMAEACRKIKGVLVVRNIAECDRVEREFGVPCLSYYETLKAMGRRGPILFDPDAVGFICDDYEKAIYAKDAEIHRLQSDLNKALTALARKPRRKKPRGRKA